ncbi:uncharacterized protein HGUI_02376 [Hanseniaspora guilliermondii]|uniref:THO complex subunit 2 n=1 Tax=Hanseniaspora guilliermondii TaxID=56406 RepID=A0A1L0B180_9ASCO|nr:uncharacterized protein HGUI_02376 [Hanseniaspora guilliermondii]
MSDIQAKLDVFNFNVNEQISKIKNSTIDPERLEKIKTKLPLDDIFNYQLKSSVLSLLENTVLKAAEELRNKSSLMKTSSMNSIMISNPLGEYFKEFIIELFEIAQSSESLKYTLKYIIDTISRVDKYSSFTSSLFLCYLIDANEHSYYPSDYAEHAAFISEFCTDYLFSIKYSRVTNNDMHEVYTYLQKKDVKNSIFSFKPTDLAHTFVFSNSYAVVSTGWCLLTHYTEALTKDGSVLVNNTFSEFYKNVIFKNIESCLQEYKISDLDYLDYLIRVLAHYLKKNTKIKIIDKKLRTIVVYLLKSDFGIRNKDHILYSLSKQFSAGVSRVSVLKQTIEDLYDGKVDPPDGRVSRSAALKRDDMDNLTYLNMGFAWVSLIFIHEGLFDLKTLLNEFSKYHSMNDVLLERLSFYYKKNWDDYVVNLREEDSRSSESALASATVLTASRDDEFASNEIEQTDLKASTQSTEIQKKTNIYFEQGSDNLMYKIPLKYFPHVLLMSAFLKVQCFKDAAHILASFDYFFLGVDDIEEFFAGMLSSYSKELIGQEKLTLEEKIERNSYYWLFSGDGKLNLDNQKLSVDEFFKISAITITNGFSPSSIRSLFDSISHLMSHCRKSDDQSFYGDTLNSLAECVINQLIPRCLYSSPSISSNLFMLLKKLDAKVRHELYNTFAKKVINENQSLKEINSLQQKQIKRFLKVVNVDNLSSQLEVLANMVNINPFVTLSNCLVLAESYDMISTMLVQSMKHFSDFSLDVLEYTILKRLNIDRPFISEEEGLALPWFAKICSLITSGFSLHSRFHINEILNFIISKVTNLELSAVFILDSFLTGSSSCLYLTDVQDELAILNAGNEKTRNIALEKVGLGQRQKNSKLAKLFSKKFNDKSRALLIFESLIPMTFEIFYDSFQTINKINNVYDMVIRVQRLLIDVFSYNGSHDYFIHCFDVPNIMSNPSFEFVSDAWKALILRKSPRNLQKSLLPELANNSLFEFFWYHNLSDLSILAIEHTPETQRGNLNVEMFPRVELRGLNKFHERSYNTEDLLLFLEKCIFMNSILGVAEAIYSAEFIFRVLSHSDLLKLLTLTFTDKFITKVVIGISSNESKFFAAFIKRVFMILPSYYETLTGEQLQAFKEHIALITKSLTGELADLILDEEYINCRNAIQILNECVNYLPPIDIFIKVLVDAIEKRLLTENRKELMAPLNAVLGFSKSKLKKCEKYSNFCNDYKLDSQLMKIDEILELLRAVEEQKLKIKQYTDELDSLDSEQKTAKARLLEKKKSIELEASSNKRLNDGEDLRKEAKKVKLNYEDDEANIVSKPEVTEPIVAKGSRFEGFDNPPTETVQKPSPILMLPKEPKSKLSNKLQDQLENADFKKYIEFKNIDGIKIPLDFNNARVFAFLESSLEADTKYMSYIVPMLKESRLTRMVETCCEIMQEKPMYFINGLLYMLIHVFTISGKMEYKQKLIDLWNKVDLSHNLKVPMDELRSMWLRLNNLKKSHYDRRLPYSYVEQIDIHVQYFTSFKEYRITDDRLLDVFFKKKYPDSAFARCTTELKDTGRRDEDKQRSGRREEDRQRNGRREGDRHRGGRQRDEGRGASGYDRGYGYQSSRDEPENRFSRRQNDRKYYRESRRY